MTAGMVRVPTIVPLRPPSNSRKNMVDTRTPIEILSGMQIGQRILIENMFVILRTK